jgi:ornithine carbamoyltransferase
MRNVFYGRDLICTEDLTDEELFAVFQLAVKMKSQPIHVWQKLLTGKTFLSLFYSPSVRTYLSFQLAARALGCYTQYLTPQMGRFKSKTQAGESIEDLAQVISGYVDALGIRIMESQLSQYGEGTALIREYAKWANIPIINMADDSFHPVQGLADLMTWTEHFSKDTFNLDALKGKTLLLSWGSGELVRSYNSPQESLLLASRLGMNVCVARPDGYDLDPQIYQKAKQYCQKNRTCFQIMNDPVRGYEGADVVYTRHWVSENAYCDGELQKASEIAQAQQLKHWITTTDKMALTNQAIFTSPMPIDRSNEVVDEVASGKQSVIYRIAKNRVPMQKAILALLMCEDFDKTQGEVQ